MFNKKALNQCAILLKLKQLLTIKKKHFCEYLLSMLLYAAFTCILNESGLQLTLLKSKINLATFNVPKHGIHYYAQCLSEFVKIPLTLC